MDINIIVSIVIVVCIFVGFIIGLIASKVYSKMQDRKLRKNLEEVIEGKRENFIEIDGKKIPAEKFRYTDKEGNQVLINLKGGIEEDAKEENLETTQETLPDIAPNIRKNSSSIRKKKRDIGRRNSIRRYG